MKWVIILLLIIFLFSFVSAVCEEGKSEIGEIDNGKIKTINDVSLGLVKAKEDVFLKRITAQFVLDAVRLDISSTNYTKSVEVSGTSYNIELFLTDSNEDKARISVNDGNQEDVYKDSSATIGGVSFYLIDLGGDVAANTGYANFILGKSSFTLSDDANPSYVLKQENQSYTINLISASMDDATIQVVCGGVVGVEEEEEEVEEDDKNYCEDRNVTNCSVIATNVCGSNDKDYDDNCLACQDDNVEYWEEGKCADPVCIGCLVNSTCYEIGNRTENKYCERIRFVEQKEKGEECNESYECQSNNCENGKCSKETTGDSGEGVGFFGRIWNWIHGLFGGRRCPKAEVNCSVDKKYCGEDYRKWIEGNCNVSFVN